MQDTETCPKCHHAFPSREAIVSRGMRPLYYSLHDKGPVVRCPHCWHIFPARQLRLLGVIPVTAHRWVIGALLVLCVAVSCVQHYRQ